MRVRHFRFDARFNIFISSVCRKSGRLLSLSDGDKDNAAGFPQLILTAAALFTKRFFELPGAFSTNFISIPTFC
jgi:hypothetical protein